MLPFTDKSFKDGAAYGAAQEREATFKWLISRTLSGGDIETHSMLQTDYVTKVLKPKDPKPYLDQVFYKVDPAQQERERIIKLLIDLKAIRRDALGDLVCFDVSGTEVIYLPGLEKEKE
jgi:hypothetical protein